MAHLVIVPVATGNILFQNRMGTFLAAVGTLAAFYSEVYLSFTLERPEDFYVQVGLLGLTLFSISLILQYLSSKLSQKDLLTKQQARRPEVTGRNELPDYSENAYRYHCGKYQLAAYSAQTVPPTNCLTETVNPGHF